jgi:signal transduction histidine kinase
LHRLAIDLRPASLDYVGLVAALQQYAEAITAQTGLTVELEAVNLQRLPLEMETALYRIAQEALTNVVRHAQATRVDVLLMQERDMITLMVEDNGVGFDPENHDASGRLGLLGIRERVEMLGGTLLLESAPGAGVTLRVQVPLVGGR